MFRGINVCDYGAVGDGETDDTEAIQKAIDALIWGRRWLVYPRGKRFLIKGTLYISKNGVNIENCDFEGGGIIR